MSTLPPAGRAARHYTARLGWTLVPIPAGSKGPSTPGWQNGGLADPAAAVRHWTRHTSEGMGLLHGASGTATIDADATMEHVARALHAAGIDYTALLAAGTPCIIGNPEKPPKLLYRVLPGMELRRRVLHWPDPDAPEDRTRRAVVLELRAGPGIQDVLPPSVHPGTGRPYAWSVPPRRIEDVPYLPAPLARLWLAWRELVRAMEDTCPWAPPRPELPQLRLAAQACTPSTGPSIIERFNARTSAAELLERHGYVRASGNPPRWTAPGSTSGIPGVVLLDDGRVYSHHGSDVLADGHAHDAFDVLAILEYGGDARAAARALKELAA